MTTTTPPSQHDDGIPVIDMFQSDEQVAEELLQAFQTIGFATLIHHGVDSSTIDDAFEQSRAFFNLSQPTKLKYKFQGYQSNRGYISMGCESHESVSADRKETFDIGNEDEQEYENHWPEELSQKFRSTMLKYFDSFDALYLKIMRLLAVGMNLPDENFLVERCNQRHENLRLLHYPSIPRPKQGSSNNKTIVRGAVHTDFGTLTLLTQDSVGGLRAQRLDGKWVFVTPVKNSIVVNVGDMLQRWSNDTLRANPHQVVERQQDDDAHAEFIPERFSIAFFCNANKNVMLECLDECKTEVSPPKYPPINAHDYLIKRLSETISKEAST